MWEMVVVGGELRCYGEAACWGPRGVLLHSLIPDWGVVEGGGAGIDIDAANAAQMPRQWTML